MLKPVDECIKILKDPQTSIEDKYDTIYQLRNWKTEESLEAMRIIYPYLDKSELLEHEVMYVFGQQLSDKSLDFLFQVLNDPKAAPVVRHEAGEALGNFIKQKDRVIPELRKYWDSDIGVLKSTVRLSITKLENYNPANNQFDKYLPGTVEPAEPFTNEKFESFLKQHNKQSKDVLEILTDPSVEEYQKYGILYHLRNKADKDSILVLSKLIGNELAEKNSPLLRHEVCFILGQLTDRVAAIPETKQYVTESVDNPNEDPIVRHEAILAYSEIWGIDALMQKQRNDPAPLVYESAQVVLSR